MDKIIEVTDYERGIIVLALTELKDRIRLDKLHAEIKAIDMIISRIAFNEKTER